jgi:hypothetical protein
MTTCQTCDSPAGKRLYLPSSYRPEGFYTFDLCAQCAHDALLDTDHFNPIKTEDIQ